MVALTAAGVAMVLVFAATCVFFVYRNDPYLDLRASLPPTWGGTRRAGAGAGAGAGATSRL